MGFFSWKTVDTGKSIANKHSRKKTFPVYMVAKSQTGLYVQYVEINYEGYGEFGGKDYYELLAEMNGLNDTGEDARSIGLRLAFHPEVYQKDLNGRQVLYPQFFENITFVKDLDQIDFSMAPVNCPEQGFFY